jgi:hypothetical protein
MSVPPDGEIGVRSVAVAMREHQAGDLFRHDADQKGQQ